MAVTLAVTLGAACDGAPLGPGAARLDLSPTVLTLAPGELATFVVRHVSQGGDTTPPTDLVAVVRDSAVARLLGRDSVAAVDIGETWMVIATADAVDSIRLRVVVRFEKLYAGRLHACGITPDGRAYCWGENRNGQVGMGALDDATTPRPVAGGMRWSALAPGTLHTCGLRIDGAVWCWGEGGARLGLADEETRFAPDSIQGGLRFTALAAGDGFNCAIAVGGTTYCWGYNEFSRLGQGSSTPSSSSIPLPVTTPVPFRALGLGFHSGACGIGTDDAGYCWGHNDFYQLARSPNVDFPDIGPMSGGLALQSVALGPLHGCARTLTGEGYCWGLRAFGDGDSSTTRAPSPRLVANIQPVKSIAAGWNHSCAVATTGEAFCWGQDYGQLGAPQGPPVAWVPVRVETDVRFREVVVGLAFTCALSEAGLAYCWGYNALGQLGDGTSTDRLTPGRVAFQPD